MAMDEILDSIEQLILDSNRVPLTNKRMVDEDDLVRLLDQLRNDFPREIQEATGLMKERQRILDSANKESKEIIDQAKNYANKLINEHAIVKQATEQVEVILERAKKNAADLKADSLNYADDVFQHVIANVSNVLESVTKSHEHIKQKKNS